MPLFGKPKRTEENIVFRDREDDLVSIQASIPSGPDQVQAAKSESTSHKRKVRNITARIPFWRLFRALPPEEAPFPQTHKLKRVKSGKSTANSDSEEGEVVTTFRISTHKAKGEPGRVVTIDNNEGMCKSIRINKKKNLVFNISLEVVDEENAGDGDQGKTQIKKKEG